MILTIADDYDDLSREAARRAAALLRDNPASAVIVATGETPMGMYRELAELKQQGAFDTSRLRIFQLDEYLGVGEDDERSLYGWMKRSFLDPLGIRDDQVVLLRGDAADPEEECRAFDRAVQQVGGLDLAILGLGMNGHLGFNEPPAAPDLPSRVVALSPESISGSARYWGPDDEVPKQALTAGMAQILTAKAALLLVSGERKRSILRDTLEGAISPDVPSSYLQGPGNVTVLADRDAARGAGEGA